jgi:hypothetical protein
LLFFYKKTKIIGEKIMLNLPIIKKLIREVELARFGFIFGTLLKAGLPILDAFDSLIQASSYSSYRKTYGYFRDNVELGLSFQKIFLSYPHIENFIPGPNQQMIIAAEQSGQLADALIKIGEIYEEKTETTTKNLAVILEPILLIIVWLGVVFVALAVIMPVYSLIGGLNKDQGYISPSQSVPVVAILPAAVVSSTRNSSSANELIATSTGDKIFAQNSPATSTVVISVRRVKILPTGTNYLNVRDKPSGKIIATIKPNETYPYQREQSGWVEIILTDGEIGWLSNKYIEKIN